MTSRDELPPAGSGLLHSVHAVDEHVTLDELVQTVDLYEKLTRDLPAAES